MSLAPTLVFAWGNASRGDDALGPRFAQALRERLGDDAGVEVLDDYQLQIEHALDLEGRERVLFVDASADARPPFEVARVEPARDDSSFSTHAMSPQALLQVFVDLQRRAPPPCWLLAIRGECFELGMPVAAAAERHLDEALRWAATWVGRGKDCRAPGQPSKSRGKLRIQAA